MSYDIDLNRVFLYSRVDMCFQFVYSTLPRSFLLSNCHLSSDTILSNTGLVALQKLDGVLVVSDISYAANGFVITCQSEYIFR
jgi:hypothetical protein